ncbi:MAG TPA: DASS family sodium-coupled anion symporter [Clostridia bacterium]|nr:DASS family sodium-coupled anion symporter [Clostridia bacterium]
MKTNVQVQSSEAKGLAEVCKDVLIERKWFFIGAIAAAILCLLPTPAGLTQEGQYALALLVLVVTCFFTEAIPLPAVALIIGSYQVLLGINRYTDVPATFMNDAVGFIMGALMIGSILVKYKIHNKIALFILRLSGTNVYRVTLGVVTFCAFSAGFISEHATATIMLPIGIGIVSLSGGIDKAPKMGKLLMLSIAYGCVIGGVASPSGGARNALMIGFLNDLGISVSYGQWLIMCIPFTILMIPIVTFWLTRVFKPEINDLKEAVDTIKREMAEDGPMTTKGKMALAIFILVLAAWITMSEHIGLGNIAIMGAIVAMILGLVDWDYLQQKTMWGVVILYAGAISLGKMLETTGAALWLAEKLLSVVSSLGITEGLPLVGAICAITSFTTNCMADGPTVAVLGPIFLKVATLADTSPFAVGIATSVSSAFAYLLIIGTPANAIVYGSGFLKAGDYLKAGSVLFLISLVFLVFVFVGVWWKVLGIW